MGVHILLLFIVVGCWINGFALLFFAVWPLIFFTIPEHQSMMHLSCDPHTTTNYEALTHCLPHLKIVLHTTSNIKSSII